MMDDARQQPTEGICARLWKWFQAREVARRERALLRSYLLIPEDERARLGELLKELTGGAMSTQGLILHAIETARRQGEPATPRLIFEHIKVAHACRLRDLDDLNGHLRELEWSALVYEDAAPGDPSTGGVSQRHFRLTQQGRATLEEEQKGHG